VRPLAWILRLAGIVLAGALLISAVVIAAAPRTWRMANAHEEVPIVLPGFDSLSQRTYVYDVAGNVIAVFERENSQPISLAQVPQPVIDAILAVEDNEFFRHKGVNLRSLLRATLSNFATDSARQGASTVTQQVVKNELLAGLERDGRYKLLQVHYALMLEKEMAKDAILERYLNTIFFGNNAYGLQAAAEVYFGKNVEELDMIEGAFLAGLIRSPSGYDPINKPERSRARFRQVTERLAAVGIVTVEEAETLAETYVLPERLKNIPTLSTKPTYYTEALREYLLERSNILGDTEQVRANQLYRGGLRIYTTFDPVLQGFAEEARNKLPDSPVGIDAAVVSLDSKTGAIRAMVGGRGFVPREREINMALVPRQTGSSIKFFILAAAIQAGAQPTDLIEGRLPCVLPNPGDPADPFVVKDAVSGFGTLESATWKSLNCSYGRLSQIVGLNRVVDTTYRLAHSAYLYPGQPREEREPIQPFASFATGANELSPLDMASGAQSLANNGVHHDPYYVERIEHADGSEIYVHQDPGVQVLDLSAALTTNAILKGVLTEGTARHELAQFPFPAAGKTGTQQDNTNSWFVGYTPHLATAVWIGDPDGYTPMTKDFVPEFFAPGLLSDSIDGVQGGTFPSRIWGAYMTPAMYGRPMEDWPAPPPPVRAPARLYLPGVECPRSATAPRPATPPDSSGTAPSTATTATATTATGTTATATTAPESGPAGLVGNGFAGGRSAAAPLVPPTDPPPPGQPPAEPPEPAEPEPAPDEVPVDTEPVESEPPVVGSQPKPRPKPTPGPVVVQPNPADTTIPPNVLDPRAPLPMVDTRVAINVCSTAPKAPPTTS
jgi:penicillin-binding protein 1A